LVHSARAVAPKVAPAPARPDRATGPPSLRAELADVIRELLLWAAGEAADTGTPEEPEEEAA